MSILVFAGTGSGHGNKNNKQGDKSNGNKAWVEKLELLKGNKIKINLTNYPEIILELKGNKKGKYAINFKEKMRNG